MAEQLIKWIAGNNNASDDVIQITIETGSYDKAPGDVMHITYYNKILYYISWCCHTDNILQRVVMGCNNAGGYVIPILY